MIGRVNYRLDSLRKILTMLRKKNPSSSETTSTDARKRRGVRFMIIIVIKKKNCFIYWQFLFFRDRTVRKSMMLISFFSSNRVDSNAGPSALKLSVLRTEPL